MLVLLYLYNDQVSIIMLYGQYISLINSILVMLFAGYMLEAQDVMCVDRCPLGFYGNSSSLICERCSADCEACESRDECVSCNTASYQLYLFQGSCYSNCPEWVLLSHISYCKPAIKTLDVMQLHSNQGVIHLIKPCKLMGRLKVKLTECDGDLWKTGCKLCLLYFVSVVISKASWERVRPAMTSVWPVTAQARSVFRVEKVSIWPTGSAGRTAPPWVTWEKTARANVVLLIAIFVPVLTRVQVSDSYYCVTNKKSATSCF